MAAEIIRLSSCRTKTTIDFSPVPWQRSLGKVNSADPRQVRVRGWMRRKRRPQFLRGTRRFFSLTSKSITERKSRRSVLSTRRSALNGRPRSSIYRVPVPGIMGLGNWHPETETKCNGFDGFLFVSPPMLSYFYTLIECIIE